MPVMAVPIVAAITHSFQEGMTTDAPIVIVQPVSTMATHTKSHT